MASVDFGGVREDIAEGGETKFHESSDDIDMFSILRIASEGTNTLPFSNAAF